MKNNWKEEFKSIEITEKRLDCLLDRRFGVFRLENLEDFIESLLAEQKKELMENSLEEIGSWDYDMVANSTPYQLYKKYIESLKDHE